LSNDTHTPDIELEDVAYSRPQASIREKQFFHVIKLENRGCLREEKVC